MWQRTAALVLLLSAVGISSVSAQDREILRKSLLGKAPPELVFQKEHWLGKVPATSFAQLKGQVVWLQFNF
jgi:hypothetical protein